MAARYLVAERVQPSIDKLQNPDVPLKDCI